jgi:thiol-disulfide isomerase/thioredoxin
MPFLIAAVVLVGAIAILNLVLTLAVIRRLRRNEAAGAMPVEDSGPAVGSPVPAFTGRTTAGETFDNDALAGAPSVIAFFSTTCPACKSALPHLQEYAEHHGLKPSQVLVVIGGEPEDADHFIDKLTPIATIVFEPSMGPISTSFAVTAFPTFVMVGDDAVVSRSLSGSQRLIAA